MSLSCCWMSVWCRCPRWAMHSCATSKMKIELPWRCVPPPPVGERRDLECRGNDQRAVGGDEPGTAVGEFRRGRRRVLLRRCRRDVGRGADDERADDRKEKPRKPHAVSRAFAGDIAQA